MLRILIVEDDSQLAATLKYLVEDNPRYRVVATTDVLWYHADYVAPSWGHRLSFAQKIGQQIFYR